eukprot:613905_1
MKISLDIIHWRIEITPRQQMHTSNHRISYCAHPEMKKHQGNYIRLKSDNRRHAVCYTAKSEPYNRWNVYTYYIYNLLDARHSLFTCHQFNICAVPRSAIDPIRP